VELFREKNCPVCLAFLFCLGLTVVAPVTCLACEPNSNGSREASLALEAKRVPDLFLLDNSHKEVNDAGR
jgi:hypothetical protein